MTLRFDCPSCKANYEVADDLAGKMIMCRVCKKRGKVQTSPAQKTSATTQQAASMAAAGSMSRRDFLPLAGLFLASVGAVVTGALLARQPWEKEPERKDRFRKGPPPGEDKKDDKKDDKGGKGGSA